MGFWKHNSGGVRIPQSATELDTSTTLPITVTPGVGSMGSWHEVFPSIPSSYDASGFWARAGVIASSGLSTKTKGALQFGIGPSGQEVPITDYLLINAARYYQSFPKYYIPIPVKSGERLVVRAGMENSTDSGVFKCYVQLLHKGWGPTENAATITTLGVPSGALTGTSVDPGGTGYTKGAWTLIGSTSDNYKALSIGIHHYESSYYDTKWFVDIAIGTSGSKFIMVNNYLFTKTGDSEGTPAYPMSPFFPIHISSGTSIYARCSCSLTFFQHRVLKIAIHLLR